MFHSTVDHLDTRHRTYLRFRTTGALAVLILNPSIGIKRAYTFDFLRDVQVQSKLSHTRRCLLLQVVLGRGTSTN